MPLRRNTLLLAAFLLTLFSSNIFGATRTAITSGNWNAPGTWLSGLVPVAGDIVIIAGPASTIVTVNINTPVVGNITVNAGNTLLIPNVATATLSYSGDMIVSGALTNNGGIILTSTNKIFQLAGIGQYIHNPTNVTSLDESIFYNSNENFSPTSTITIQKWFNMSIGLGDVSRVQTSDFGHVVLNVNDTTTYWEQNGDFMTPGALAKRIYGTLTVMAGTISMDDGTAGYTYAVFNDITITGTGRIIFNSGPSRPYVLETNTFQDNSSAVNKPTILQDNCFGFTQWNITGNATFGHDFYGIVGTGTNFGGNLAIAITGYMTISGGSVQFVSKAFSDFSLTVAAATTISGNPTMVRFIDGNGGNLNFTTNDFIVSGGGSNILMGGNTFIPAATGTPNINITNNFTIDGASYTALLEASVTTKKLRLFVGNNFTMSNTSANLTMARTRGALTLHVNNALNFTAGKFIGQFDTLNTSIDSVIIGNTFTMNTPNSSDYFRINYGDGNTFFKCIGPFNIQNAGTALGSGFCGIYRGRGNMTFNALSSFTLANGRFVGIYSNRPDVFTGSMNFSTATNLFMTGGFFRGIDSRMEKTSGTITFYTGNLQYSGGNFSGYYASNDIAATANYTINGICQITFPVPSAATDSFSFAGIYAVDSYVNQIKLNVSIAGNLNITGSTGSFISSVGMGRETISILSEINISGGKNSFNSYPNSGLANPHPVIITVGTNVSMNGGLLYLSANNDSVVVTINGNLTINLGELNVQSGYAPGIVNVLGGFTQTGGLFYFHNNTTSPSLSEVEVTINSDGNATGDFVHSGGTINFDNNASSVRNTLYIKSPNVTYSSTTPSFMTMALPGTNTNSGVIDYVRTGTINFTRSGSHSIQQIEQRIEPGCTLVVVSGNLQISSLNVATSNLLFVSDGAVLDLQGNQIFSNALQANSGMIVAGRLRTTRTQGLYDGSANAAINSTGLMVYRLQAPNSVVEYYGVDNQVITGIGVGTATASSQKYYNLEINFNGTPDVEFVYPTNVPDNTSVFVRNKLILTKGELNLDNDHNPISGGRSITIERDSVVAITSTPLSYIRSEVNDSSASVIWRIGTRTGPHVIPFGYSSAFLIPFTFDLPSGNADTVTVATYHTPGTNIPYPPGVTHVHGLTGADNSGQTVDRFWYLDVTGTAALANLSFKCTPAEASGISFPRAQLWIPSTGGGGGWQLPYQGNQTNPFTGTYVQNATYFPNWWTLSGLSNPLPVSLLDFSGDCNQENVELKWATASELNNDHFTVLKSYDGNEYRSIGTIAGNGSTSNTNVYNFLDRESANSLSYYKLLQTDYDGRYEEFGPVIVKACIENPDIEVTILQGIDDHIDVLIQAPSDGNFKISIITLEGKPVNSMIKEVQEGLNVVTLNNANLASGLYLVRVENDSYAITKKVVLGLLK